MFFSTLYLQPDYVAVNQITEIEMIPMAYDADTDTESRIDSDDETTPPDFWSVIGRDAYGDLVTLADFEFSVSCKYYIDAVNQSRSSTTL